MFEDGTTLALTFGATGNANACQGAGWSDPNAEFTWTNGKFAELLLPRPPPVDYVLVLLHDTLRLPRPSNQRVTVSLRDSVLADYVADPSGYHVIPLPVAVVRDAPDPMRIRFDIPDALSPADHGRPHDARTLGLCFRYAVLRPAQADNDGFTRFLSRTENLGRNCEFGLVQRAFGHESMGLLRFAASPADALICALRRRFDGIGQDVDLHVDNTGEWLVKDRTSGLEFHSRLKSDRTEAEVRQQEARRLPRLAAKLIEDMTGGEKVLVFCSAEWRDPMEGFELLLAIRDIGSGPVLLVAQGAPTFLPVDWRCWGATLPRLTRLNAARDFDAAGWLSVLGKLRGSLHGSSDYPN